MEHYAPLPCDACNYGTYTPFSQQGGTSFPQFCTDAPIANSVRLPGTPFARTDRVMPYDCTAPLAHATVGVGLVPARPL